MIGDLVLLGLFAKALAQDEGFEHRLDANAADVSRRGADRCGQTRYGVVRENGPAGMVLRGMAAVAIGVLFGAISARRVRRADFVSCLRRAVGRAF